MKVTWWWTNAIRWLQLKLSLGVRNISTLFMRTGAALLLRHRKEMLIVSR